MLTQEDIDNCVEENGDTPKVKTQNKTSFAHPFDVNNLQKVAAMFSVPKMKISIKGYLK